MKRGLILLAAAVIAAGFVNAASRYGSENPGSEVGIAVEVDGYEEETDEYTVVREGDMAPDFTITMLGGEKITLSELKGKVVLVNFWATWCPPCRKEFTRIPDEIVERFKGQNFVLLAISRGEEADTVAKFMADNGYSFDVGLDGDNSVYSLFATNYIPRNYLIDKTGKVVMLGLGYESDEFDAMVKRIAELIGH